MSNKTKGVLAIIVVSLSYSILAVAIRLFQEAGIGDLTQVSFRLIFAILPAYLLFKKDISVQKLKDISKKDWILLILMGTVGYAVAVWLLTLAYLKTSFLSASTVYNLNPIIIYAFAFVFGKAKLDVRLILLTLAASYGVTIVATNSWGSSLESFGEGEIFALLSTSCFAWYYFSRKLLSKSITDGQVTVITIAIAAIFSTGLALLSGEHYSFAPLFTTVGAIALLIGIVGNVVATYYTSYGFNKLNAVLGSQLLLTEVIFTAILGIIFYNETIGQLSMVGVVFVLLVLFLVNKRLGRH